ncbi:SubName: Full=Uncharacterized protein {ECO:0000313/EMBL:CCA68766.1} [Serendipita indica DSM 11827]|nr:SubName: Full=Uncharacterized protein {ECO:0000313/EMBL:CCA68766.1} [Serendipita indica DSM 11827]
MTLVQKLEGLFHRRKKSKTTPAESGSNTPDDGSSTLVGATPVDATKKPNKPQNETEKDSPAVSGSDAWIGRGILFLKLTKDVSEASEILAPLKAACGATVTLLESIQAVGENKDAWRELVISIKRHLSTLNQQLDRIGDPHLSQGMETAFTVPVVEYQETLQTILAKVFEEANITEADLTENKGNIKRLATRIGTTRIEAIIINRFSARLKESNDLLVTSLQLYVAKETGEMKETLGQVYSLLVTSSVVTENFRHGNQHARCLEGTRDGIIQELDQWARMVDQDRRICFVEDIAGVGKSTLAKEMVSRWEEDGLIAARFFFCRGQFGASNAGDVVRHLATDLARTFRPLRKPIYAALQDATLLTKPFATRWRLLVEQPLQLLDGSYVIVLMHSTNAARMAQPIIGRTRERTCSKPLYKPFRTLPTFEYSSLRPARMTLSRLLMPLSHTLSNCCPHPNKETQTLRTYDALSSINSAVFAHGGIHQPKDALIERSENSFLFASTACAMLRRSLARSALLTELITSSQTVGLDGLYLEVLKRSAPDAPSRQAVAHVLEAIITAPQPPTLADLINQLSDVEDVSGLLHALSSVVHSDGMDDPIWIMHATFRDFLLDPTRALDFAVHIRLLPEEPILT